MDLKDLLCTHFTNFVTLMSFCLLQGFEDDDLADLLGLVDNISDVLEGIQNNKNEKE